MSRVLVVSVLIACLAVISVARAAEPSLDQRLARTYLAAYSAVDTVAMAALIADDVVFTDLTLPPADDGPLVINGRDAFLKQLKSFGVQRLVYDLTGEFESNGRTVFVGRISAYYPRPDGRVLRWRSEVVTIVTVANGKVVRHEDFANYAGAQKTVEDPGAKR